MQFMRVWPRDCRCNPLQPAALLAAWHAPRSSIAANVVPDHSCTGSGIPLHTPQTCTLHRPPLPRRYTRGAGDTILGGDAPFSGQALGLLFNLAVGGVHSGVDRATCLATLKTEQSMLVDWVRIYTKKVRRQAAANPTCWGCVQEAVTLPNCVLCCCAMTPWLRCLPSKWLQK